MAAPSAYASVRSPLVCSSSCWIVISENLGDGVRARVHELHVVDDRERALADLGVLPHHLERDLVDRRDNRGADGVDPPWDDLGASGEHRGEPRRLGRRARRLDTDRHVPKRPLSVELELVLLGRHVDREGRVADLVANKYRQVGVVVVQRHERRPAPRGSLRAVARGQRLRVVTQTVVIPQRRARIGNPDSGVSGPEEGGVRRCPAQDVPLRARAVVHALHGVRAWTPLGAFRGLDDRRRRPVLNVEVA
jgi:hypothetical protein